MLLVCLPLFFSDRLAFDYRSKLIILFGVTPGLGLVHRSSAPVLLGVWSAIYTPFAVSS